MRHFYLPSGLGVRLIDPFVCIKIGAFNSQVYLPCSYGRFARN